MLDNVLIGAIGSRLGKKARINSIGQVTFSFYKKQIRQKAKIEQMVKFSLTKQIRRVFVCVIGSRLVRNRRVDIQVRFFAYFRQQRKGKEGCITVGQVNRLGRQVGIGQVSRPTSCMLRSIACLGFEAWPLSEGRLGIHSG